MARRAGIGSQRNSRAAGFSLRETPYAEDAPCVAPSLSSRLAVKLTRARRPVSSLDSFSAVYFPLAGSAWTRLGMSLPR